MTMETIATTIRIFVMVAAVATVSIIIIIIVVTTTIPHADCHANVAADCNVNKCERKCEQM